MNTGLSYHEDQDFKMMAEQSEIKIKTIRDIKFRAWDYQNNKWATDNDIAGSVRLEFGIKDYFINIAGERAVRFSFMQYTGLKDKNGKDVYEWDVVEVNTLVSVGGNWTEPNEDIEQTIICKCVYREETAAFDLETIHEDTYLKHWGFYGIDTKDTIEVIGNVHQNPELLK